MLTARKPIGTTTRAAMRIAPVGQPRALARSARVRSTRSPSAGGGVSSLVAGFVEEADGIRVQRTELGGIEGITDESLAELRGDE